MKKWLKYFFILIGIFLLNQLYILSKNNSLKGGFLKSNSENKLHNQDIIELDKDNLYGNIILIDRKKAGIIQFYIGSKVIISNLTLTEWYLYEEK